MEESNIYLGLLRIAELNSDPCIYIGDEIEKAKKRIVFLQELASYDLPELKEALEKKGLKKEELGQLIKAEL